MIKVLAVWNAVVTVVLIAILFSMFSIRNGVKAAEAVEVVRTRRLEIIDQRGKTKAVLEANEADPSNPELTLYDDEGRKAVFMTVNSKGYGTMYFQSKQIEGKVWVGYLWGSDALRPVRR